MDTKESLGTLISQLAAISVEQWAEEDKSRSPDDHQVAAAKRAIDKLNQRRHDLVERIDEAVMSLARDNAGQGGG